MYQNALRTDKKILDKMKTKEWHNWFQESPQRHYRRLYATHLVDGSLDALKNLAEDALTSNTDFGYVIKTQTSELEDVNQEPALVMVSGSVETKQKLSARSIKKVEKVISISKKSQSSITSQQKNTDTFVDISINKIQGNTKE